MVASIFMAPIVYEFDELNAPKYDSRGPFLRLRFSVRSFWAGAIFQGRDMTTQEIANQLVALCRAGKNVEAVDTLLGANVVSIEAVGDETMPAVMNGRDAIRGKNEWWLNNHKVHSARVKGPYPNGDRFAVIFDFEVTPAVGPMAGQRMRMEEIAVYSVADGKIAREEFFYDMSGASMDGEPSKAPTKKTAKKKTAAKAKAKAKKPAAKPKAKTKAVAKTKAKASKPKVKARKR